MTKGLKRLAALLAVCMALGAAGCKGDTESGAGTGEGTAEATSEPVEEAAKVGYIFNGRADNGGTTEELNFQRLKAGSHSDLITEYIDNVTISDFEEAVKTLVEDGCSYIVAASPVYGNVITSVAGKYMNVNFVSMGSRVSTGNVYAYTEIPYQAGYVAGLAAAFNSENEKVGVVADISLYYHVPFINAVTLGAQLVYDDASVVAATAAAPDEIRKAVDALVEEGCDVIVSYTVSPETAEYCERKGIKFIGNKNYGEDAANYENMLMYFYSSRDSFFLSQFKQISLKTWMTDEYVGTMGNGVINISEALPAANDSTQALMNTLAAKVAGGQAYIFSGELKDTSSKIRYTQYDTMSTSEIYNMEWYVYGTKVLETFRQPKTDLEINSFEIKE
ncbi:MAG: BMP family ABC transporter substrate-binding protein [Oscillospiraceae bacterium]|nr:BMP family ABC transporter substrate-binding protein [Oscillospiraceae bacterium]